MSSNYDIVLIEDGLDFPEFDGDASDYDWQTRFFPDAAMRWHRLTTDGTLYRADHNYDDRGLPANWGQFPDPSAVARGDASVEFDWVRCRLSGTLRLTTAVDADAASNEVGYITYDLRFEMYELAEIERVETPPIDESG